jgi:flavodoxin
MKTLIVYSSKSGNTLKLAETVFGSINQDKDIFSIENAPGPSACDMIALGFWVKAGKPDPLSIAYLPRIGRKPLFLFGTHGAIADSDHAREALDQAKSLAPDANILGAFNCQGEVNPELLEKVRGSDHQPVWIDDVPDAVAHPDADDLERLKQEIVASTAKIGDER